MSVQRRALGIGAPGGRCKLGAMLRVHVMLFVLGAIVLAMVGWAGQAPQPESSHAAPPKLVLAFYYPWYGTPEGPGGRSLGNRFVHWEGVDVNARSIGSSTHYPTVGAYDSRDPAVIDRHADLARTAGIDCLIISWWGKGSFEDAAVKPVLDACARKQLRASIYYEQVAKPGTPESVAAEIVDLVRRFGDHPALLRVTKDGHERPVIFVYGRAIGQLGVKKWASARRVIEKQLDAPPLLIGDDFGDEAIKVFDGAHSYGPAGDVAAARRHGESTEVWAKRAMGWWAERPRREGKISCATVFPGYDDTKVRRPGLKVDREGGKLYQMLWREAVAASPDWVLITSFNEWHEGSEIEPSVELADAYVMMTTEWSARFKHP